MDRIPKNIKNIFIVLLVPILFIFVGINFVDAGFPPPSAKFSIKLDKQMLGDGEWNLYLIDVEHINNGVNEKDVYEIFSKINKEYLKIKASCGLKDSFKIEKNKFVALF